MNTQVKLFIAFLALSAIGIIAWPKPAVVDPETSGLVMSTGNMTAQRFDHTATLLPNGKVFIAGGLERNGVPVRTAELYDPQSGRFKSVGEMKLDHGWGSLAVLLQSGEVLLAGGSTGPSRILAGAELYDPSTNVFSLTGSMGCPREGLLGVRLTNGDVLVIGGDQGPVERGQTAELYHPSSGTFSATGSMHTRDCITALFLKNGKVLVVGASSAEIYDPSTGQFTLTGHLKTPRTKFGTALLPDGKVLVAGGQIGGAWGKRVADTEIYDPSTGEFASGPEMAFSRFKLMKGVVTLKDGRILVGGGAERPEVFDPLLGTFASTGGRLLDGFLFSTATALNNGDVLLVGGYSTPGGVGVNHAWLYHP